MKRTALISLLLAAGTASSFADNAPKWLRDAAISPDGTTVAFTYKGDIFTVPVKGGTATQITSNQAYDGVPVWSKDGKNIVFLSTREGSDDIFITSAKGGTPRRLTTNSGNEKPLTFLNDSILLFSASNLPGRTSARAPFSTQVYQLNVNRNNPRPKLYLSQPVISADANASGDLLYQDRKGVEDVLRKHERSSGTADIWYYGSGKFSQLTNQVWNSQCPVWGKGDTYYYVSEKDGTLNVFEGNLSSKSDKQLTKFTKHPVRSLSSSDNGTLAFSWDGEIYTLSPGSQPQKVNIQIIADEYDSDIVKRYERYGASDIAVSPEGKEVAFIIRGDVYVTDTEYETTKRITDTPAQERTVSFSPDGRTLVFDSDVDGIWQLFTAKIKNDKEKQFAYATDIIIEPLYKCGTSAMQPQFSPDGKKVAFLEDRTELKIIDVDTKKVTTALDGKFNYSYSDGDIPFSWSPDSKWLLVSYIGIGGWNNTDIALVKADGSEVIDLTESGYSDYNPKWALGGKALTYSSGRFGMKAHGSWGNQDDIILMVLDDEAWDKFNFTEEEAKLAENADNENEGEADSDKKDSKKNKKDKKRKKSKTENAVEESKFDLANRRYRTRRLTNRSSNIYDYYLSPKGDKLYFVAAATEGGWNMNVTDLKKGDTKVLLKGTSGTLYPDKKGENLFVQSYNGIKKVNLASADVKDIEYNAPYDRKPSLERAYIFDHMAKQVKDKFYDEKLHGVDWDYYTAHYREFLPYISNNRDFATLLSEILGELNASHTGGRYYSAGPAMYTGSLGAYFDENYEGEGLKIVEIFPRGPLAAKSADLQPGDIILSIDGNKILSDADYFPMLEGKVGKKVRLEVKKADGKVTTPTVKPISAGSQSEMAYQRWVARNEQLADSLSDGKIGYVHIKGMDTQSFQSVYDRLLGKYRNCDAVVVDTRYNGGGWLHNDIAVLLNGKEYVKYVPRGKEIGHDPFAQWTKPSVMLVNESNYSDAHGTPYAYKALGIGEVIGAPIPGTMTAVWWETQIDPTLIFGIPQVTNMTPDGTVLENTQLNPDILIYNHPSDVENGKDAQLEGAVRHLMEKTKK
ncbi:MAG: PDZ domain-containing protein [Muribaculaceae bacterium]|nr:PDZ domain-containing protein [Muribaculaceae bacterium]